MVCDTAQGGTVMDCPTCFQKITAPHAPASDEQKFILTGQKFVENKNPASLLNAAAQPRVPAENKLPEWVIILLIVVLAAGGAGVFFIAEKRGGGKAAAPVGGNSARSVAAAAWRLGDIGEVGAAGSFSAAKGLISLTGSGADIWQQADGFYYAFQPLNGDGSLTAEILNIKNTDEWAKAGVMIRETTNASSGFALASLRADGQAQFIWRKAKGAPAEASDLAGGNGYPKWVKVTRSGNRFSAFYKLTADGNWETLGTEQTINMASAVQIGLIVCAHNAGMLCQAQFDQITLQADAATRAPAHAPPKIIAPPASDTNWLLTLGTNAIPDAPVAGRIHGRDFISERATFQNGTLTLRQGTHGPPEFGVTINFSGALAESLSGQTLNIDTNADKAARVTVRWKDDDQAQKGSYDAGYAMRLEFGALEKNRLPGKIYLCLPDAEKSYLLGTFTADARKPKPKQPKK